MEGPTLWMVIAEDRRNAAGRLVANSSLRHILRNPGDLGHPMGIVGCDLHTEVENSLRRLEAACSFPVDIDGQRGFIHEKRAAGAGVRCPLLHHDYNAPIGNGANLLDDNCREEYSYVDQSLHLTPTGQDICPPAYNMLLEHTPVTRDGEAGGRNMGCPVYVNWSAEAHPTTRSGRGGDTGTHTSIDIASLLLQSADFVREKRRETVGSRRYVYHDLRDSISTATLENHYRTGWERLDNHGCKEYSYMDRSLHLIPTGHGFSQEICPHAYNMLLGHTPTTGDGEARGGNIGCLGHFNWSAEAHPTARAERGGDTGAHTSIDIPSVLLQSADFVREERRETVGSRSYVYHDLRYSVSTAPLEKHYTTGWERLDDHGSEELSYMDRSLHWMPTGRGFSQEICPHAYNMLLEPTTGDGEAGGRNIGCPGYVNWSAEAHSTARAGRGGDTGAHTSIDIPSILLQSADFEREEQRETDRENARASRILETTIGTLLPAAVVNARDFFSDAPDIAKLAGHLMLPALLGFCFIGMLHKRRAGRILRLATCAGIAATTLGVSSQLSDGIYIFIATVAGVALSFITLTA